MAGAPYGLPVIACNTGVPAPKIRMDALKQFPFPDGPETWLLVAAGILLLVFLAHHLARRTRRHRPGPSAPLIPKSPATETPPKPAPDLASPSEHSAPSSPESMESVDEAIQVGEVSALEEAEVFIQYGYLDRAANLLQQHLTSTATRDPGILETLLNLHLRLGNIDAYADLLEQASAIQSDPERLRQAIIAGLRADPENLPLRVLAQTSLGLGVQHVNTLLGIEPAPATPEAIEATAPAPTDTPPEIPAAPAPPQPVRANQPTFRKGLPLLQGEISLSTLNDEEKSVLRAFAEPARAARIHLAVGSPIDAIPALQRAIHAQPKALVNHVELLKIYQAHKQIDAFVRTLWQLFVVLGPSGQALKDRWLSIGFSLGQHPALEALAQARDSTRIETIGQRFGFRGLERGPARKRPLVELVRDNDATDATESSDATLQEIDSYLEFGQIDLALERLEQAILSDPMAVHLYPPLLELYDRMDALGRLTDFASQIKQRVQRPPEEVVAMMSALFQRLKDRTDRIAA